MGNRFIIVIFYNFYFYFFGDFYYMSCNLAIVSLKLTFQERNEFYSKTNTDFQIKLSNKKLVIVCFCHFIYKFPVFTFVFVKLVVSSKTYLNILIPILI